MTTIAQTATLAHGYTMASVERLSWKAARKFPSVDPEDAHDAAWHAIVELLYSAEERPTSHDLWKAAFVAAGDHRRFEHRHHGWDPARNDFRPSFGTYWLPTSGPMSDFTEKLIERMALPEVLGTLSDIDYEALATMAVHDTHAAAAKALGIKPAAFTARLMKARRNAVSAWFDFEAPPRPRAKNAANPDTCRYGHSRAEHSIRMARGEWRCRKCTRAAKTRRLASK